MMMLRNNLQWFVDFLLVLVFRGSRVELYFQKIQNTKNTLTFVLFVDSPENNNAEYATTATIASTKDIIGANSNALLYIDCAAPDKTFANKKTTYEITPDWQAKEMELTIQCPPGIIGSLYVCFADKDKKGRTGHQVFEGRDYELVKQENEESWVKLHIMREDSNDGILRLKAKLKNGPDLVISKVAIVEE